MARGATVPNQLKAQRQARGWSQEELARRAGVSRTEISAIEGQRLVPSVATALSLAAACECRVEELFGRQAPSPRPGEWAWAPPCDPCRFWQAEVDGRLLMFPVESSGLGLIGHDGLLTGGVARTRTQQTPQRTLIMACCDPAASLLAAEFARTTPFRLLVLQRSSGEALRLLDERLIHVAGVHLAPAAAARGNSRAVRSRLGPGFTLLHVARWQEGVALGKGLPADSVSQVLKSRLRWVGRERGAGARQCQDELLEGRPAPKRVAGDHRSVAAAIRQGWADVGICLRLAAEEAGLEFLSVRDETYDVCTRSEFVSDPRWRALAEVVRSSAYRQLLGELPGYDVKRTGEIEAVQ